MLAEVYCKDVGLELVWMQFASVFGPGCKASTVISYALSKILNDEEATFGPANQMFDFIYIDDLVNAIAKLGATNVTRDFYYVGSGSPRPLHEFIEIIGQITDKRHLLKIGAKPDDGVKYNACMFDISSLLNDIGDYSSTPFDIAIKETIAGV